MPNKKTFVGLARVSSREQEREGFSLEVQEEALTRFASQRGGVIDPFFKIAETASKSDERKTFKELIAYVKANAHALSGVLFFKVDRAARNLFDYVELERLEADHGVPVYYVSQPTEQTPAGRMMRRTLANMAAFYTEQQSLDVRDGHARRVQAGWFVGKARYGYINVRRDGRSIVELEPAQAANVKRIYELYAYHAHTLESLRDALAKEGRAYTRSATAFPRSVLHVILRDRAYLGEVQYHGRWLPGRHEALVDLSTFTRVQTLLGSCVYQAHELAFGSELVKCARCGRPVTGEVKTKKTAAGLKHYVYYRCANYNAPGHERVRVTEAELDRQILELFDSMRIEDASLRDWFLQVLRARARESQKVNEQRLAEINRQLTSLRDQLDRLLNLRLLDEVDGKTFSAKNTEIKDRIAELSLQVEVSDRSRAERAEVAEKAFELSQSLREKWVKADPRAKRQLLDIVCLNLTLDRATLVVQTRKPFDVLVKGLSVQLSRGGGI